MFAFPKVIQGKEDVCVFANGVVGEALKVDEQVVRYRYPTGIAVPLPHTVPLGHKYRYSRL